MISLLIIIINRMIHRKRKFNQMKMKNHLRLVKFKYLILKMISLQLRYLKHNIFNQILVLLWILLSMRIIIIMNLNLMLNLIINDIVI